MDMTMLSVANSPPPPHNTGLCRYHYVFHFPHDDIQHYTLLYWYLWSSWWLVLDQS